MWAIARQLMAKFGQFLHRSAQYAITGFVLVSARSRMPTCSVAPPPVHDPSKVITAVYGAGRRQWRSSSRKFCLQNMASHCLGDCNCVKETAGVFEDANAHTASLCKQTLVASTLKSTKLIPLFAVPIVLALADRTSTTLGTAQPALRPCRALCRS